MVTKISVSAKNENIERATIIHPDGRTKMFRRGVFVTGGSHDARLFVVPEDTPSWEQEGMDIVVSKSPGSVDFSGTVVTITSITRSMANPIFNRRYSLEDDS